jgi:hypothetical protein
MPEEKFWTTTPRTLNALAKVHRDINSPPKESSGSATPGQKKGFIDQVLF